MFAGKSVPVNQKTTNSGKNPSIRRRVYIDPPSKAEMSATVLLG